MARTETGSIMRMRHVGQRGSALMFVLIAIVVIGILTAGLAAFASANQRATSAYRGLRADKYAADAAIKETINWISKNDKVAVDPNYQPTANKDCVYRSTTEAGQVMTVDCKTERGSGAGVPPDAGLNPPEALLLLGQRHNEPGPYSYARCGIEGSDWWGSVVKYFTGYTPGSGEASFTAQKRMRNGKWGIFSACESRDRGIGPIRIEGDITAAGQLRLNDEFKLEVAGGDGGVVKAQYGCNGAGTLTSGIVDPDGVNISSEAKCNYSSVNRSDPGKPWNGTSIYSDPGRKTGSINPIGDIRDEFLPVGFDSDGTVASGYTLPERDGAYVYDKTVNTTGTSSVPKFLKKITTVSDASGCKLPAGSPVIFLWGHYTSAETVNKFTSDAKCVDRTFWFAPNPGPDQELLTADDQTAAFYMDFTSTASSRKCGGMVDAVAARWCLGGADKVNASKPRVVVGWPKDWTAMPTDTASGTGNEIGYGNRVGAFMDTAGAVEGNFLSYWTNTNKAKTVDTVPATYKPCVLGILWWVFPCPSFGQRSLRLAQFTPAVAAGPIAEVGFPNGRLYVDVTFAMKNANSTIPKIDVDYLDPKDGVAKNCSGSNGITLQLANVDKTHTPGTSVAAASKATISDADAATLAANCGYSQAINNMRVTFRVDGNAWNTGQGVPSYDLDGVRVRYDSYQGASFPLPLKDDGTIGAIGADQPDEPAKSDCDETKPGGQLIFGGQSHVYVADGSLEVCGGPNPADPSGSMVIGIYGVPAVDSIRPTSATWDATNSHSLDTSKSTSGALRIGDPSGSSTNITDIKYGTNCAFCGYVQTGRLNLTYPGFTPPSKYQVKSVSAMAAYDPNNADSCAISAWAGGVVADIINFFAGCSNPWLEKIGGSQAGWPVNMPTNNALLNISSYEDLQLYPRQNRLTQAELSAGLNLRWAARGKQVCAFGICSGPYTDQLDGVELLVDIEPTAAYQSQPMLHPQSGCIVAHPNYDSGESSPDCALVRADSYTANGADATDTGLCIGSSCTTRRTNWFGRVSVKGTIYAPSSALEIDDNDIGYPLATRGIIARHLRISGARPRSGFDDPMIGSSLDKEPKPRAATLTACVQSPARLALVPKAPCDPAQDRVVARAGLTLQVDPNDPKPTNANVARVEWFSDDRTPR